VDLLGKPVAPSERCYVEKFAWDGQGRLLAMVDHWQRRVLLLPVQRVWKETLPLTKSMPNKQIITLFQAGAYWLDLSPDGRLAATGARKGGSGVDIWDTETGKRLERLDMPTPAFVRFSPDGSRLLTIEGAACRLWRVHDWTVEHTLKTEGEGPVAAFSRDGRLLAITHNRRLVKILDTGTLSTLATLAPPLPQEISYLAFRPDGRQLAVATNTLQVHLWDLDELRRRLDDIGLAWGPTRPPRFALSTTASPSLSVEVLCQPVRS